jgi:hypothetical protein
VASVQGGLITAILAGTTSITASVGSITSARDDGRSGRRSPERSMVS